MDAVKVAAVLAFVTTTTTMMMGQPAEANEVCLNTCQVTYDACIKECNSQATCTACSRAKERCATACVPDRSTCERRCDMIEDGCNGSGPGGIIFCGNERRRCMERGGCNTPSPAELSQACLNACQSTYDACIKVCNSQATCTPCSFAKFTCATACVPGDKSTCERRCKMIEDGCNGTGPGGIIMCANQRGRCMERGGCTTTT